MEVNKELFFNLIKWRTAQNLVISNDVWTNGIRDNV